MRLQLLVILFLTWLVRADAQTLRIYHIDVDQADATLIVSPGGQTLLIDSGKNGHGGRLRNVMQTANVTQINHFIATHYHEDHYGGIDELTQSPAISIANAYDRGDKTFLPASRTDSPTYREYDTAVGSRAVHLMRGESIALDPLMQVTCISSGGVVLGEQDPVQPASDENDMSISLLIQFGNFRYFIGADIETPTEQKIADGDLVLDVDVYQADHHGADNGSSQNFLDDLQPSVIIISNGTDRKYRHPRETTLTRMTALNPAPTIFQINKYLNAANDDGGNVADQFIGDLESNEADGTIVLTVDQSAGNYTVAYRDQSQTFAIKSRTTGSIVIESLLPDPTVGPDRMFEEVTLRNTGSTNVSMDGWFLHDAGDRVWNLSGLGTIAPGASTTIRRDAMPMSLNNNGDTIRLVDPNTNERDRFQYTTSEPGVTITTGH
jgi:competence protein ComEC